MKCVRLVTIAVTDIYAPRRVSAVGRCREDANFGGVVLILL